HHGEGEHREEPRQARGDGDGVELLPVGGARGGHQLGEDELRAAHGRASTCWWRSPAKRSSSGSFTPMREMCSSYSSVPHAPSSASCEMRKKGPTRSTWVAWARSASARSCRTSRTPTRVVSTRSLLSS